MTIVNTSAKVRKLDCSPDAVALVDVLLIALIFSLSASSFVLAPGLSVDLPSLPSADAGDMAIVTDDVSVVNARGDNMLIFDGAIYSSKSFSALMRNFSKEKGKARGVLLIKADKGLAVQTLVAVCRAAKLGGFSSVQIAAKPAQ